MSGRRRRDDVELDDCCFGGGKGVGVGGGVVGGGVGGGRPERVEE